MLRRTIRFSSTHSRIFFAPSSTAPRSPERGGFDQATRLGAHWQKRQHHEPHPPRAASKLPAEDAEAAGNFTAHFVARCGDRSGARGQNRIPSPDRTAESEYFGQPLQRRDSINARLDHLGEQSAGGAGGPADS